MSPLCRTLWIRFACFRKVVESRKIAVGIKIAQENRTLQLKAYKMIYKQVYFGSFVDIRLNEVKWGCQSRSGVGEFSSANHKTK